MLESRGSCGTFIRVMNYKFAQGFGVLVTVGETSRHLLTVPTGEIGDAS